MEDQTRRVPNRELITVIIEKLQSVHDKPPMEVETGMREVELHLVDLRDELIESVRQSNDGELRKALDQVNTTLSLVMALEYPVSGLERGKIKEATDLLKTMTASRAS